MDNTDKEDEFYSLTPKRRSILWDYDEDGNARIINIKIAVEAELKRWFEGVLASDAKVRGEGDLVKEGGELIRLNEIGTTIWELCDGVTTTKRMLEILSETYEAPENELKEDLKSFLNNCKAMNVVDVEWRCME
jgi:hypothetical protein